MFEKISSIKGLLVPGVLPLVLPGVLPLVPIAPASSYCASKFALEGFSEAVAYELASQGIVVKIVEPHGGVTATRFSEKAAEERAGDDSLADYDAFVARTNEAF